MPHVPGKIKDPKKQRLQSCLIGMGLLSGVICWANFSAGDPYVGFWFGLGALVLVIVGVKVRTTKDYNHSAYK
ncbi:hypothetical protein [Litoreibacter roseus]|uniref:Uncharacterized protein n=1 Tax=Litoreibacter roseus TaxID=2601869 RepID=A0A6N6JH45_9RHOB|nr:hypothetical protein [Litoreibacter roseus]GFE65546.1 hypothetical protein KIN_26200 [Litoreibacter roseus]